MRVMYPLAHHIVSVSQAVQDNLRAALPSYFDPQKMSIIYNPLTIDLPLDRLKKDRLHQNNKADCPVILAAGRIQPPKDFETIIKAAILAQHDMRFHLKIMGDGRDKAKLVAQYNHHDLIKFVDFSHDFGNALVRSDVFVFASSSEGFGCTITEAMACGIPVIATAGAGGSDEITGPYFVPPSQPAAMADAFVKCLRGCCSITEEKSALNAQSQSQLQSQFMPHIVMQRYLRILESL